MSHLQVTQAPSASIGADTTASARFQIGDWWVDPAAYELGRAGESVRIEPKAMAVLVSLADHAGQVVSRDALMSGVWPGVVVGDEALTQTIIKLRRALGDNPRSPAFIETISKGGYRLIAPVWRGAATPAADSVAPDLSQPLSSRTRRRIPWLALAGGILITVTVVTAYHYTAVHQAPKEADAAELDDRLSAALTITVMPFESLGPNGEHAYLARGISDDLITDLARLPGFHLIRAASSTAENPTTGGARYLIQGSIQREADTLRINIQLVDTETNQLIGSERFERPYGDLFATQDEIVRKLTERLPAKLTNAARQRLAYRYTRNLEAYDYFLRAQAQFHVRQAAANIEARELYRKALELDPKFARAYAGMAMTYAMDYRLRPPGETSTALARALELAESARLIDPNVPELYWALGFVHVQSRRHEQAIESLRKAIELNRSFADAYALLGGIHTYVGQSAMTIPLLRTAMRLNPDGGYLYFLILGRAYLFENDTEQALINLRQAAARNPADLETHVHLAAALAAAGDRDGAAWEAVEIRSIDGGFKTSDWLQTYPMSHPQYRDKLVKLLTDAGL